MSENGIGLTHRERVLMAMNHQEPDRVPMASFSMVDAGYAKLREYLGLAPVEPRYFGAHSDIVEVDEDVNELFDLDTRNTGVTTEGRRPIPEGVDVQWEDAFGVGYRERGAWHYYPVKHPLAGERTVEELDSYPWPSPDRINWPWDSDDAADAERERAMRLRQETDYALMGGLGGELFMRGWWLCGDDWFINMKTNPPFVDALLDKALELSIIDSENKIKRLGKDTLDVSFCTGDDLGAQAGPLISPELYRRFIQPRHKQLIDFLHKSCSAKIIIHSDGSIYRLMRDIVETGTDGLNPIQVEAAEMGDTARLKREFGKELFFWAGLDIQHVLPFGTPQEVKDEVKRRFDDLAPGGGFVFTPRGPIRPEVPPENIVAMYEAAHQYGRY